MKNLKICRTLGCRAVLVLVSVALLLGGPPRATGQAPPVSTIQPAVSVVLGMAAYCLDPRLVGGRYETTVTHFSPVNMDVAFDSGACTNITVDTAIMPVPFKIRMTPVNGDFVVDANHQNQIIGEGNRSGPAGRCPADHPGLAL